MFIYQDLVTHPESFIEIAKWTYVQEHSSHGGKEEQSDKDRQVAENKALIGYRLLNHINVIPGVSQEGVIDKQKLNAWIDRVRQLASEADRVKSVDSCIGRMLAQFPRRGEDAPPEEICEVIERLASEEVCSGYRIGLQNKVGVTVRSPYAGGEIERGRAALYTRLADLQRNRFPAVAAIFEDIAQTYTEFGLMEDREAKLSALEY